MGQYRIAELGGLEESQQIRWLLGIRFNPGVPSEPLVDVLLERKPDAARARDAKSGTGSTWAIAAVGVGQLPLLYLGSIWRKTALIGFDRTNRVLGPTRIDTTQAQIVTLQDLWAKHGNVIPKWVYGFGDAWSRVRDTKLLAVGSKDDPFAVLIPCFEVIRVYYAVSSRLSKALFWGELHDTFNPERTHWMDDAHRKIFQICVRKNVDDEDAPTIARWLTSDAMGFNVSSIYKQLQLSSLRVGGTPETSRALGCGFPFQGESTIDGKGIRIPGPMGERKLFLTLTDCFAPMPFDALRRTRDNPNDKGENSESPDLELCWPQGIRGTADEIGRMLQSANEPDMATPIMNIVLPGCRFHGMDNVEIIEVKKKEQQYRSARSFTSEKQPLEGLGTGDGKYSHTGYQRAKLTRKDDIDKSAERSETKPTDFQLFNAAISLMRDTHPLTVTYVSDVGDSVFESAEPALIVFPTREIGMLGQKASSWAYISDGYFRRPRMLSVVHVRYREYSCYVFEGENSTIGLSTQIVATPTRSEFDAQTLRKILFNCAKTGRWLTDEELPELIRATTTHRTPLDALRLSKRIFAKIEQVLAVAFDPLQKRHEETSGSNPVEPMSGDRLDAEEVADVSPDQFEPNH